MRQHTHLDLALEVDDELPQHTSAYVSIRQHTSAYVSMRQHTHLDLALEVDDELSQHIARTKPKVSFQDPQVSVFACLYQ